jgi:hypothetical protein
MNVRCPHCGTKFGLDWAVADADWQEFLALRATLPTVLQRAIDEYLELFKPAGAALKPGRMLRLARELAPMIGSEAITRHQHTYAVPVEHWRRAMMYLVDTPPATMTLPLKTHGYLLSLLASQCEQLEARAEQQRERTRRRATREPVREVVTPPPAPATPRPAPAPVDRERGRRQVAAVREALK